MIDFFVNKMMFFQLSAKEIGHFIIFRRSRIPYIAAKPYPSVFLQTDCARIKSQRACFIRHGAPQFFSCGVHAKRLMKVLHKGSVGKAVFQLPERFQQTGYSVKSLFRSHTVSADPCTFQCQESLFHAALHLFRQIQTLQHRLWIFAF